MKLVNPLDSGVYTLPLVLSLVASSLMNGIATQRIGYYVPSMLLSPSIMSIGEGLLSTLNRGSPQSHWVGYQFLSGFGLGMGMQTAPLAVQTVLPMADVAQGIALVFFMQQLGGAIFTTVGQTILSNLLVSQLTGIPGVDPQEVIDNGATELTKIVPAEDVDVVISAYDYALTRIFLAAMGLAFAALLSAAGMEWKSIKKGIPGAGGPGVAGKPSGPGTSTGFAQGPPTGMAPASSEVKHSSALASTNDECSTSQWAEDTEKQLDESQRGDSAEEEDREHTARSVENARDDQKVEDVQHTKDGEEEEVITKIGN